jgi:hypothetical protein
MEHLQRRGLRLYFRIALPKDILRWFGGRRELRRSLRTGCYNHAKTLVAAETAKAERLFMQIRGGLMTADEIRRLVSAYFERTLEEAEDARADGLGVLKDEREDGTSSLTGLELHLEDLTEDLARGETRSIAHVADAILEEIAIQLDKAPTITGGCAEKLSRGPSLPRGSSWSTCGGTTARPRPR